MLTKYANATRVRSPKRHIRKLKRRAPARRRVLNDVHAKLNETEVSEVVSVNSEDAVVSALNRARHQQRSISISGGRHAMGGQQFALDAIHLDMRPFNRVLAFDGQRGTITVEAGIEWPKLMRDYHVLQHGMPQSWGIRQKQDGRGSTEYRGRGGCEHPWPLPDRQAVRPRHCRTHLDQCRRSDDSL